MLTTLTDHNKSTQQTLSIRYTNVPEVIDGTTVYKITRYCTKQYSYIGLSYDAAMQGVEQKISQYTRFKRTYSFANGEITWKSAGIQCDSSIVANRQDGGLYTVDIQVNEVDEVLTLENVVTNYESYFTWISPHYDENNPQLFITSVVRSDTSLRPIISYVCNIPGYDYEFISIEYIYDQDSEWQIVDAFQKNAGEIWGDIIEIKPIYYRLRYFDQTKQKVIAYSNPVFLPAHEG